MKNQFSWEMLASQINPLKGPLSKKFGFVPDPWLITETEVVLPKSWTELWLNLPKYYINKSIRQYVNQHIEKLDVQHIYETVDKWSFLKTKSVVFNIAQAWVDCAREIGDTEIMPEPPPIPKPIMDTMNEFITYCDCPDYCTLADMCLVSAELVTKDFNPFTAHFDELKLVCPVNGASTAEEKKNNDLKAAETRKIVENRFHLIPTIMEYRTSDLPWLVSEIQHFIYLHNQTENNKKKTDIERKIATHLNKIKTSFYRLRETMTLLKPSTVNPVVWHRDVVKFTAGYGGHLGSSGPQTPIIHLIDVLLGREAYSTELGQILLKVRKQLQSNHKAFIKSVENGPNIRRFAQKCKEQEAEHPVTLAYNAAVEEYVKGFLTYHRGKAVSYAHAGFGKTDTPRIFTAGTSYHWPNTHSVTDKLKKMFDEASQERANLDV